MVDRRTRAGFEAMTYQSGGDAGLVAAGLRREMTSLGLRALAAQLLSAAVLAPERLTYVYDNAAAGWLARPLTPAWPARRTPALVRLPESFWNLFWSLVEMPLDQRRRLAFTAQMAYLTGLLPEGLNARVAAAALDFAGVREAAASGLPPRFSLGQLAQCRPGTLGGEFYMQIRAKQSELEILAREDLNLHLLPPPLDYLNARILQCHGLWRIAAGYGPTTMDEIGLAAFQMAQFGHHYSAVFTAVVVATAAFHREAYVNFVLDTIFLGWTHGRDAPPLLGVDWERLWDLPLAEARTRLRLPVRSPEYNPLAHTGVLPGSH